MPRIYDEEGRKLLASLCIGRGLDIGCNEQKITSNCIGVDIDSGVCPDIVADMNDSQALGHDWDFIVASHVLEHAYNTIQTLTIWMNALKLGGTLGVIVPHGEYTQSKTLGDASLTHQQLFTPKTLHLFLEHVGFSKVYTMVYDRPAAYKQIPSIFGTGVK